MADMLKTFVKQELGEQIKTNYPHLQYPLCMLAKIKEVVMEETIYICTIEMLDKSKSKNIEFPIVPYVKTTVEVKIGNIVVVCLLYGDFAPFILGRYVE